MENARAKGQNGGEQLYRVVEEAPHIVTVMDTHRKYPKRCSRQHLILPLVQGFPPVPGHDKTHLDIRIRIEQLDFVLEYRQAIGMADQENTHNRLSLTVIFNN